MPKPDENKNCLMNDAIAEEVEAMWKDAFPSAAILPMQMGL